ncbi:MAG: cysteine dioxygenase family protein [Chloroflexi bacterium]|nr:cysteine dioxygenase family protein [Chloroflexota bacterium]
MSTKNITIPQPLARFVDEVVKIARSQTDRQRAIDLIDPLLKELLSRPDFLTEDFTRPIPDKFAQYLIYRSEDRSLSVMAMVVPVGCTTPIHDHLAWGLVGVYQGTQLETVYRRTDDGADSIRARLVQVCANVLEVGDITHLLPPEGDIHKIETISQDQASVSIHILGNDIGCQWRHAFDMEKEAVYDFRSGYVNADCDD